MQVIGHRGVSRVAPENTWVSFDTALAMGVDAIETDVRATSDGQLILIHDKRLERTTNGVGFVKHTPWAVVKDLDAGSWFDPQHENARVPALQATLERYRSATNFVLEIKKRGIESAVVSIVRYLEMADHVTFTSFHLDALLIMKRASPESKTGYLTADISHENVIRTVEAGINQFCPSAREVNSERVRQWKRLGLEVRAWGVKDRELAVAARDAGVDGMTVGQPAWLQ